MDAQERSSTPTVRCTSVSTSATDLPISGAALILVARACEQTGLDDLGLDGWQVGLTHLLDAVARDVVDDVEAIHRIEAIVVERLVQRLRIHAWYAEHGEEAVDRVEGPLVVFGLPRTATTAVHHLLSVDPQFRYLRAWEVSDPVPPPDAANEHADPRRPTGPVQLDVRHIKAVDGPAEDWPIHAMAFDHAELTLPVPSHAAWWRSSPHAALLSFHERVLRLLHAHRPPHRWLLKMPSYLFLLREVAAHYPEASFVMTHRDPVTALASTCSTVADARRKRTPTWVPGPTFGQELLDHWAEGMHRAMAAREAIGEDRFVDVAQHELESDPIGTAERVFARAGLALDGAVADAMGEWAARNRRGSRGAHQYSLEDHGLSEGQVREAFALYLERFSSRLR